MMRCIALAKKGLGTTYPNPLVGSVIVFKGKIIGEGWHVEAGKPHAEVHAIQSVKDQSLLKHSSIYVSLEPCSHFGKTPPCADLIIEKGIKNVIIGSLDPNPKVSGKGIERLKKAGCIVSTDILKGKCDELNKRFFTFHSNKRPYIILKWAQSQDGFISPENRIEKSPVWITNKYSRQLVHKWRAEEQAILVGTQTILDDNPSLSTRDWKGNSPIRIVLDRQLRIPKSAQIYDHSVKTIILTEIKADNQNKLFFEPIDFSKDIASQLCSVLFKHQIQSVIIEGGSKTLQTFIDTNLWDEARVFTGPIKFREGLKAPIILGQLASYHPDDELVKGIKEDVLKFYIND